MGRREYPISSVDPLVAAFAQDLRDLRREAGSPTYRDLAARAHFAATTLSLAASGSRLPSLEVTLAYVAACGGDEEAWRAHWHTVAAQLGEAGTDATLADAAERDETAASAGAVAEGAGLAQVEPAEVKPAQLPGGITSFVGRTAEVAALDRLSELGAAHGCGATVALITGPPGIGKTALAVHWAHRAADHFTDGQLYVNLRGYDPSGRPTSPAEAIRGFLDALGVQPTRLPLTLAAQTGLYRSLLARKRLLILLDNARDADQVRQLLPGSPGCLTLVTSRSQLTSLVVAEGAKPIELDVPSEAEGSQMLRLRLGQSRLAAEPEAVRDIVRLCARLPLALSIAAARAAVQPNLPLADLASQLRDNRLLDALDGGDPVTSARSVFSWSYQCLSPAAARLFRLVGVHPGPSFSTAAAASMAGLSVAKSRRLLAELVRAHLISDHVPGRYGCHDLLRAYAAELSARFDTKADRQAVLRRTFDHYLHTGHGAAILLFPGRERITLAPRQASVTPELLSDHQDAQRWFAAEYQVLLRAVTAAADAGFDRHAWQITWALANFLDRQGHWHEWADLLPTAVAAAQRCDDVYAQALTSRALARAYNELRRYDESKTELGRSLELYQQLGDQAGLARVYLDLCVIAENQGDYADALGYCEQGAKLLAGCDRRAHARAVNASGWCHALLGDYRQTIIKCTEALRVLTEMSDSTGMAGTLHSLSYAHYHLGDYPAAIDTLRRCLALCEDNNLRWGTARALNDLGDAYLAVGDAPEAARSWRRALEVFTELGLDDAEQVKGKLASLNGEVAKHGK